MEGFSSMYQLESNNPFSLNVIAFKECILNMIFFFLIFLSFAFFPILFGSLETSK